MKVRVVDPKKKKQPTAAELEAANKFARDLAIRKGLLSGENTHVGGQIPKFVDAATGQEMLQPPPPPMGMLSNKVPLYVKELQWDAKANLPYYIDEKTGDTQYVAKDLFYSPRFKRTQTPQVPISSLLNGMAKR